MVTKFLAFKTFFERRQSRFNECHFAPVYPPHSMRIDNILWWIHRLHICGHPVGCCRNVLLVWRTVLGTVCLYLIAPSFRCVVRVRMELFRSSASFCNTCVLFVDEASLNHTASCSLSLARVTEPCMCLSCRCYAAICEPIFLASHKASVVPGFLLPVPTGIGRYRRNSGLERLLRDIQIIVG